MKHILKKLGSSKFIASVHKQLMAADSIAYLDMIKLNHYKFNDTRYYNDSYISKIYNDEYKQYMDLKIKFEICALNLYDVLEKYIENQNKKLLYNQKQIINNNEYDAIDLLIISLEETEMLIGTINEEKAKSIKQHYYDTQGLIPLHETKLNLDFDKIIYILWYNQYFKFKSNNN